MRWSVRSSRGGTRTPDPVINSHHAHSVSVSREKSYGFGTAPETHPKRTRTSPDKSPDTLPALIALATLLACQPPTQAEPFGPTPATELGAQMARDCGQRFNLRVVHPLQTIELYLVERLGDVNGPARADSTVGRRIYVPRAYQGEARVWGHSMLHSIFGLPGNRPSNHPMYFQSCGLNP